jgi:hypothetical protein
MGKFLKWTFVFLLCIMALGAITIALQTHFRHPGEQALILTGSHGGTIAVAANRDTFRLFAEIGEAYNYVHNIPNSKEDRLDALRSQQLAVLMKDGKIEQADRKKGLVIEVPDRTACEEIQRNRFAGSRLFPDEFIGVQVRITGGPHKGFEGWVFPSQVTTGSQPEAP